MSLGHVSTAKGFRGNSKAMGGKGANKNDLVSIISDNYEFIIITVIIDMNFRV